MNTVDRRDFIHFIAGLTASAAVSGCSQESTVSRRRKRPNFILIMADDLGWGDLGCYGHPQIRTPNLDRLASEGTLFTQFYVNSPVCSPSRCAFLTGHFPGRHAIHGHFASDENNRMRGMPNYLDPAVPFVTGLLKKAGYVTGHFGKWHLGGGKGAPDPGAYGIDDHRTCYSSGPGWDSENTDPYFRAESTRLFVDEAIRFIEAHREQSFYVNLWPLVPHAVLHPTEEQMKPYMHLGPLKGPYKGAMQIYYGTVDDMDAQLGRLFRRIEELGLREDTVIIFTSDNGPDDIHVPIASHSGVGSPGPFRGRKRSLYEGGVRMPFIIRWPEEVPAGRVNDASVISGVDFLPTVCRLAGIDLPQGMILDGEDISDILCGAPRLRTKPLLWEWRFGIHGHVWNKSPMLAIREWKWKFLMNPDSSRMELYDILADPMEMNNLSSRQRKVTSRLSKKLLAWSKELPKGMALQHAGLNDYPWPEAPAKEPER